MIKNPKLGQKVFFIDDDDNICEGRISQVYNDPSIGIDNFFYLDKKFAFPTRNRAFKYILLRDNAEYDRIVLAGYEKEAQKSKIKLDNFLK